MEDYVQSLIKEINYKISECPPSPVPDDLDDFIKEMVEVLIMEKDLQTENYKSFSEITGIPYESFPNPESLNIRQMRKLSKAMEELLWAHHYEFLLPELLPPLEKYELFKRIWSQGEFVISCSVLEISPCDRFEDCPFPDEYCSCRIGEEEWFWEELMDLLNRDDDSWKEIL